jgi:hypothetical protein
MTRPAFTSNQFCLKCRLWRDCKKMCPQLESYLQDQVETEQKEFSLFQDEKKGTSDHIISKIEGKFFFENKTISSETWLCGTDELSQTLVEYSLPHLTATENKIRYLFEVVRHSHRKISEILKIKKEKVRKIYFIASEKVRLGTQGMAEKYPGRYSRKSVLVKPEQTRAAILATEKPARAKSQIA